MWDIDLAFPHGDIWVPFDAATLRQASTYWGHGPGTEGWFCYYEDDAGEHCGMSLPWGTKYCERHSAEPEPEVPELPHDEKVVVVCPETGCTYRGSHRRGSLLIEYALAAATRRQHAKLSS